MAILETTVISASKIPLGPKSAIPYRKYPSLSVPYGARDGYPMHSVASKLQFMIMHHMLGASYFRWEAERESTISRVPGDRHPNVKTSIRIELTASFSSEDQRRESLFHQKQNCGNPLVVLVRKLCDARFVDKN